MNDHVTFARDLAFRAHSGVGQMYGPGIPYFRHLSEVATIVAENTDDPDVIAAAWLHDIAEDVKSPEGFVLFPHPVLVVLFNERIAKLVHAVTDAAGPNRKVRKALTLPVIAAAGPDAVLVKLADRIANTASSRILRNDRLYKMYGDEYPAFRAALYPASEGRFENLWEHLDNLTLPAIARKPVPTYAP